MSVGSKISKKVDIMNIKLNTIWFIFLLFLLIGVASATDLDNETQQQTIEEPANEICQASLENQDCLEASNVDKNKLESTIEQSLTAGKIKVNIKSCDVKMHYKDGSKFTVTLKDQYNQVMKKAKVKIRIDGKTYTKTTDSKGKASISLNLKSGKYTVVTTFDETALYKKQSVKNTVTIKSTIKCSDFSKYYKNKAAYYSTFYDKKGKLLKETSVKFQLNSKSYSVKTNKKGVGKLEINLKPGKYSITSKNSKTAESITKSITIKSLIETKDLTMNDGDGAKFTVKILNCYGKASPNKKVTIKVNGNTYTPKTDSNGLASVPIDLDPGKYSITTEYDGLKNTNQITVNKAIKHTKFSHITSIPNYVNVTVPYVFHNSAYSLKTGCDGIIKMPKNEVYTIQISETKGYLFTRFAMDGVDSIVIGYKTHLIPFDGSEIKSAFNKDDLKGDGILISSGENYTEIEYRSTTAENTELFGVYLDRGLENSETITYIQNNRIKAMINYYTYNFDEFGLQYNLAKFYSKSIYDFNYKSYDEITENNSKSIKFANTGESVTFSLFGRSIVGYLSKEYISTKMIVAGIEELEKAETISYGLSDKYRNTLGFEVLQGYAIINEKITKNILENWVNKNSGYLARFGIMNVYGMFLASLETAWLADEMANHYAKEFGVTWKRSKATTILGGINLEDTYLHMLNADMGMKVSSNKQNTDLFKLINSLGLPNIEDYVLEPVADRYMNSTTNSLDNVLNSMAGNNYGIVQFGEMMYLFGENDSAIVLNTTDGVSNVILAYNDAVYKGSRIHTSEDCCGVGTTPKDIIKGIRDLLKITNPALYLLSNRFKDIHPLSLIAYKGLSFILGKTLTGASASIFGLATMAIILQDGAVKYRDNMISEKDWHAAMDGFVITRPGYFQSKKLFVIPKDDGGCDYVEVKINNDLSLDRNNAIYISSGQTKKLTEEETYQYFSDDYWSPFNVPQKYWDDSWRG